jgi:hypothetical protein
MAWIGHREPLFEGLAWICVVGFAVNTIGTPSYFSNLGTGAISTNTISHALATLLAIGLGWWGGTVWGAYGVGAGHATGQALGGLFAQLVLMKRLRLGLPSLIPVESRRLLMFSIIAVALCVAVDGAITRVPWFSAPDLGVQMVHMAILIVIFTLVTGFSIWSHPLRRTISVRIMEAMK